MNQDLPPPSPPARILLATDLSARCDRALDRAAQLATQWPAELIAFNVLEVTSPDQALAWTAGADDKTRLNVARQHLSRDLSRLGIAATLRTVCADDVGDAIEEMATSTQAALVVTGVARDETLGRFLLGSTVESLAQSLPQPLLVVRQRAWAPYQRIVITSDFSAASANTVLAAARLFAGRELILYHADEIGLGALAGQTPEKRPGRSLAQARCAQFLASLALPAGTTLKPVIEHGSLEPALTSYVRRHDIELVVMGRRGHSGLVAMLLGRTSTQLLDWLPCDVLIVPAARSPG